MFLADHAHAVKPATLDRRLAAIAKAHKAAGHHLDKSHPAIRDVRRGIRRTRGVAQRRVDPITVPVLRRLLDTCGPRLLDVRDRSLLPLGHVSALRRSELVGLDVEDVTVLPEGLRVVIRRSKTDQEGEGQIIAIGRTGRPGTCPAAAYAAYVSAAGIATGPAFSGIDRHGHLGERLTGPVAKIVKRRVALAGLDRGQYSGYSLRAGLATAAAAAGIEERRIMKVTRHASVVMVRRYIRATNLFEDNVAADLGL